MHNLSQLHVTSSLSFANCSLYLFHLVLLLEGEFGLETPQREISEEASFHNEMMGGVTRDGSWCSILEELWKQADQTERDPKNQNKPSHQGAFFNKKTLNTERDCDYKYPGTVIQAKPHLVSSQKGPHKHFSVAKRLKPNLEATHQNQSSITKHLDDMVGSGQPVIHSSSSASCKNTHTGENFREGNTCTKAFSQKQLLTQHQVHAQEKPDKCTECGRDLTHKSHLLEQQRFHSVENLQECGKCGKAFTSQPKLGVCVTDHTGNIPYICKE